jgi:hypothetical protein
MTRTHPGTRRHPAAAAAFGIPATICWLLLAALLGQLGFALVLLGLIMAVPAVAFAIVWLLGRPRRPRRPAAVWHPEGSAAERAARGNAR